MPRFSFEQKTEDSDHRNHAKNNIGCKRAMPGAPNNNEDTKPKCQMGRSADSDKPMPASKYFIPASPMVPVPEAIILAHHCVPPSMNNTVLVNHRAASKSAPMSHAVLDRDQIAREVGTEFPHTKRHQSKPEDTFEGMAEEILQQAQVCLPISRKVDWAVIELIESFYDVSGLGASTST
jgi:hypothetical protein